MDINFNGGKIFCTKCGTPNKAGYRFCVKCGTKLMTPVSRPQEEDVKGVPKVEPAKAEPEQPMFSAFEQAEHVAEPVNVEVEPAMAEPVPEEPTFSAFEQAAPAEEPEKVESEPEEPTFSAFEQEVPKEEPVQTAGFAEYGQAAFEAGQEKEFAGFARSGFTGATTPTAAAGAFATALDAVKNNKQIDVSDAETVMSLLEQGESSALAKGLPAWDIVPPQVVVRRKHRV